MQFGTLIALAFTPRGWLLARVTRLAAPFLRVTFLSAALSCGLVSMLAGGPLSFEAISEQLAPEGSTRAGLLAWLGLGVRLRVLSMRGDRYELRGWLARSLALRKNDAMAALLEELGSTQHLFVLETPGRLREGRKFRFEDQGAAVTARSSRVLEPFVREAVRRVIPRTGPVRLLEVGCGSGTYMRYAAVLNPQLRAVGLELQAEAAALARRNIDEWKLGERVSVESGDVRSRVPNASFDAVTLHNAINYFTVESRVGLLAHLRAFLKPGGRILLTCGCVPGGVAVEWLNLWGAMTDGCGPFPTAPEMVGQLEQAGFLRVKCRSLIPGAGYYSFAAENSAS